MKHIGRSKQARRSAMRSCARVVKKRYAELVGYNFFLRWHCQQNTWYAEEFAKLPKILWPRRPAS